ncbi:MAG: DsbA family protein [Syntrophales bacterium]
MAAGPTVRKIREAYQGKIKLVVKNFPYILHAYSHIAAEAALAASDQGKYWEMYELLFARSPKLDRTSLIGYARELGLDVKKFTESIDGKRHAAEIERDKKLAADLYVFSTPTFFINGRKFVGDRPFDSFKKIIDEELKNVR